MAGGITIRRVRPDEWERLRALRLAALADAPAAFGSTLAEEAAFPEPVWQERAVSGSSGVHRVTLVAEAEDQWLGLVTGDRRPVGSGGTDAWVIGMWSHPDARGRGVARALLSGVATWARERGADALHLHVTETNEPAIRLYQRLGFRPPEARALEHTPPLRENHMVCALEDFCTD